MPQIRVNLDDIPDLPSPLPPGKYELLDGERQVVVEVEGALCPLPHLLACSDCGEWVLGTCGKWHSNSPSPSGSQLKAFRQLITKLQEEG
jgi:hypothetical protein